MDITEKQSFVFEAFKKHAATRIKKADTLLGKDGVFTPLLKQLLEEAMNGELEAHIDELPEWNLDQLAVNWEKAYPKVIESWRKNWPRLSNHFLSHFLHQW